MQFETLPLLTVAVIRVLQFVQVAGLKGGDQNIGNEEGNPLVLPLYIHHVFLLFMYSLARIKDLLRVG